MNYKLIKNDRKQTDNKALSFLPVDPQWTLDEIIMPNQVREAVEDVIAFCKNQKQIVQDWELSRFLKGNGGCIGVNMHGNPGTGKSITAEAIANAIGRRIIMVKLSEMIDSLQGKTEKNLTELFDAAQEGNYIILFDEADSLLSKRSSGANNADATNIIKSHLLNLLDRKNVIVVFTTNFFKNYDRAFVRRILFNIKFPDPTKEELVKLWRFHLTPKVPKDITYEQIADLSEGLTGGDIKHLTLKICTRLSSNRINRLDEVSMKSIITEYKNSIKQDSRQYPEIEIKENNNN